MSLLRDPRVCMWTGRLVPAVAWSLWLVAILMPDFSSDEALVVVVLRVLWLLSLAAYLLWVYFVLPYLLFEGDYRGVGQRVGYFLFAIITAGIGPVVWYFLRVDRVLQLMAASKTQARASVKVDQVDE